jgi:polyisoprenoid-binding protein YceI
MLSHNAQGPLPPERCCEKRNSTEGLLAMQHPYASRLLLVTLLLLFTACTDDPLNAGGVLAGLSPDLAPPPGDVQPRRFVIQEGTSQASYSVREELFDQEVTSRTTVRSTFQVAGTMDLRIDPNNGGVAVDENQITVNLESLTSNEARRDNRIRREWLESTTYPLATFVIKEIQGFPAGIQEGAQATFQLVGDLTIREVTHSTTFTTTAILNRDTISGTATTQILMRDFGFEPPHVMGILSVTDGVTVTLRFVMKEN